MQSGIQKYDDQDLYQDIDQFEDRVYKCEE